MNDLFARKRRRPMLSLQLTALIDVFAMLVIFLVKGTVFGLADIPVPNGMALPESVSKESVESAPRVTITQSEVRISSRPEAYPIAAFRPESAESATITSLKRELASYVQGMSAESKSSGALLNVIADKKTPYRDIFDTVRVFREAGFETLLFVASGPGTE